MEKFVNGFESWTETYFLIVEFIVLERNKIINTNKEKIDVSTNEIAQTLESQGTTGLWQLAVNWANEFEKSHENEDWEDRDFYETIEAFCETKNKI